MKIRVKINSILPAVRYTNRNGEERIKQEVTLESESLYPDEFVATIWGKTTDEIGIFEGKTYNLNLSFTVHRYVDKNGIEHKNMEASLWGVE